MLSGKFDPATQGDDQSRRASMPFPPVDLDRTYDLIDALREIARSHAASVAQVALAWLLHRRIVSTVLVGAKRVEQLDDNLGAVAIELSDDDLDRLETATKLDPVYPRWMSEIFDGGRREQIAALGQRSRR